MGNVLETRRSDAKSRFERLQKRLTAAEDIAAEKACVYATGSYGRGEASEYSDLALFIVGRRSSSQPDLSHLDQICLKANACYLPAERVGPSARRG